MEAGGRQSDEEFRAGQVRMQHRENKAMSMKIGIVSDTHDFLRREVAASLQDCERILHCGDICSRRILDQLESIAPVKAVRGNGDGDWAGFLPETLDFGLDGLRICMAHKKKDLPKDLNAYDLAICGHTHQYASEWLDRPGHRRRTLLLNPGSCGPGRFFHPVTMAVLRTDGDGFSVERIEMPRSATEAPLSVGRGDLRSQIETVIRETQKGLTTDEVARKHHLDPKLTEQIARLYVTHPGVTADGIMTKMGL